MRKLLLLVLLAGCGDNEPPAPRQFALGEEVTIKVNDKRAVIIGVYDHDYGIHYSNDLGTIEYELVGSYELAKLKKGP